MGLIQLALYKGQGNLFNRLIRWWTGSPYSHCELIMPCGTWLSASAMDGGVRPKNIQLNPDHWDLLPLPFAQEATIWHIYRQHMGKGYDWLGLFGAQVFGAGAHSPKRMFCSEFCAAALSLAQPQRYSPALLAELVSQINHHTGHKDEKHA